MAVDGKQGAPQRPWDAAVDRKVRAPADRDQPHPQRPAQGGAQLRVAQRSLRDSASLSMQGAPQRPWDTAVDGKVRAPQIETSHARGAQLGQRPAQGGTSGPSSVPSSPRTDAVSSLPTSALFPSSGSAIFMQKDERVSQRLPPGNLSQLLPGAKRVPLLTAGTAGSSLRRKGLPAACGVRWLPLRARSQHGIV